MEEVKKRVQEELGISIPLIDEQMTQQAGRYAYWASLAAEARRDAYYAKVRVEVVEAQIGNQVRITLAQQNIRAVKDLVEEQVKLDPRWAQAWNDYNDALFRADILDAAKTAFAQRKDMFVTIAANLRGEMGGQVRTTSSPVYNPTLPSGGSRVDSLKQAYLQQQKGSE